MQNISGPTVATPRPHPAINESFSPLERKEGASPSPTAHQLTLWLPCPDVPLKPDLGWALSWGARLCQHRSGSPAVISEPCLVHTGASRQHLLHYRLGVGRGSEIPFISLQENDEIITQQVKQNI